MHGDKNIALLLGVGTGVCGAAAIAAVAPILKSREKDTAISIGIIALIGTIFSLIYTAIYSIFSMTTNVYGAWSGVSLHEIAHVVLAGGFGGSDALKIALPQTWQSILTDSINHRTYFNYAFPFIRII